ncbi:SDR family NAD(P)-dependent oxidoreductase [Saccharothrix variisporea]|uniref:3-oxoacyl-[acyl-carrier protein] reductase n=1 Tax=Saccharothrix variisporea TaxID=543527 RepID=A0A495XKS7_9PSEU|nr:SDR family NAD(P)-dependent oxidoreductase [Saccharothrix variisporea]RKT74707.1 3-oxoacyl-[acyl-carrier protein] reductase [Saccharothrix variisporea]
MKLAGKVAVVTGGAKELGAAVTRGFLAEGARVVCAGRDEVAAKELVDSSGGDVVFHPVDVRHQESVRELFDFAAGHFGAVDVVVANAGVSRPGPIAALALEAWTEVFDTNVTGLLHCLQAAVPVLERGGGGRIITMSSALGARAVPGASAYCASKAAVEMLTKVAAIELAPKGISVNCLSPGFIDVGMGRQLAANEAVWSQYRTKLAAGRMGTAEQVAAAAVYLASADADYVNGHVLAVDGGLRW